MKQIGKSLSFFSINHLKLFNSDRRILIYNVTTANRESHLNVCMEKMGYFINVLYMTFCDVIRLPATLGEERVRVRLRTVARNLG